jgi:MATE family multidrug resistance protein
VQFQGKAGLFRAKAAGAGQSETRKPGEVVAATPPALTGGTLLAPPAAEDPVQPVEVAASAATPAVSAAPLATQQRRMLRREVLTLAWPSIVENFLQTMVGVVDTALVGHLSTDALAGVGGAQQIVWLLTTLLSAAVMGTTVLVGRAIGARQRVEANRALKQSALLAGAASLVLAAIIFAGAYPFMRWMGLDAGAADAGTIYLQITALSTPFLAGMFVGSAALRGAGNTRISMYVSGLINAVNAVLAWWMIYGFGPIPAMGVAGSALAAGIARVVGCAILFWVLTRRGSKINILGHRGWRFDRPLARRILNIGIPTALEQFFFAFGVILYGLIVISLGTEVYATQRASMTVIQLSQMPGFGFAVAATTMVAQGLGAGKVRQAEASASFAMRSCVIQMSVVGLLIALFGDPLMRIFTSDEAVVHLGAAVLPIIALNQPFMAVQSVLAGALRGAGDTRFPMITSAIGIWVVRLPIGWLLGIPLGLGLYGIYVMYVVDAAARAALVAWRWRQGKWQGLKV